MPSGSSITYPNDFTHVHTTTADVVKLIYIYNCILMKGDQSQIENY